MTKDEAKYEARDIAKFFLDCAQSDGVEDMTPLKIQKLVYFAQGFYLAMTDGKSLIEENVYAWQYGPVIKPLYRELKLWGSKPVPSSFFDDTKKMESDSTPEFLRIIWNLFKKYSPIQLSIMTHEKGGPWDETRTENPGSDDALIPPEKMTEYFKKFYK
jgi:uncharacterized phage-associated protein